MPTTHRMTPTSTNPGIVLHPSPRPRPPIPLPTARHRLDDPTRPGLIHAAQLVATAPTTTIPVVPAGDPKPALIKVPTGRQAVLIEIPERPAPVTPPTTTPRRSLIARITAWLNRTTA